MLAEVSSDVDLYAYGSEAFFFLLLLGGLIFFLSNVACGHTPVSSAASRYQGRSAVEIGLLSPLSTENPVLPNPHPVIAASTGLGKKERRSSLRRHGNPVKVAVSLPAAPGEPLQGSVLNRSRGGLQLSVNQAIAVGTVLGVRANEASDDLPWVQLRVRRCRQSGDHWAVGCQFVETLPWSVLLLFG